MNTIKDVIIKFQEYQLEKKPLNANFAHNAVANNFLEQYPDALNVTNDDFRNFIRANHLTARWEQFLKDKK